MANPLQIKNRIAVIKSKMTAILRQIAKDYDAGLIRSDAELQHRIFQELNKFYQSIGKSTFEPIYAWGPPYSKDHNQMMTQIQDDLLTLYSEVIYMTKDLMGNFEQVELERQSFDSRLKKLEDTLKGIGLNLSEPDRKLIFRDYFVDQDQYAPDMVKGTPAQLSAEEGLLTLARVDDETYNDYASITIVEGNGFPGNTHVVRSVGSSLKYDGQEGLHISLSDILDGNADTWFEYEIIELTEQAEALTEGKGFEYSEAIDWITKGTDPLRLVVKIELDKAKTMNWLSLSPFVPSDKGSTPPVIEKIVISDDKGTIHTAGEQETFNSQKGYLFPRQKCKTITMYLRQDTGYETTVGHVFYKQINKESMNIVSSEIKDGIRVHGPAVSIQNLGITYDTGLQQIVYPIQKFGDTIVGEEEKKQNLFNIPVVSQNLHAGLEQVPARRYVIGLRDASLASYSFEMESEYVSKPFYSTTPLKEIELEIDTDIPAIFPQDQEWLEYYISVDSGRNWNPIHPRNTYRSAAITKYIINSSTPKEVRTEEIGYIESLTEVHQVQLKILLKRPEGITDASYYTPIVYGYELHALAAEEASS